MCPKKGYVKKKVGSKKILTRKFFVKIILDPKNFGSNKILVPKEFWVKK